MEPLPTVATATGATVAMVTIAHPAAMAMADMVSQHTTATDMATALTMVAMRMAKLVEITAMATLLPSEALLALSMSQ